MFPSLDSKLLGLPARLPEAEAITNKNTAAVNTTEPPSSHRRRTRLWRNLNAVIYLSPLCSKVANQLARATPRHLRQTREGAALPPGGPDAAAKTPSSVGRSLSVNQLSTE